MKDLFFPPYFIIKDGIHGLGVFLTQDIKQGQALFTLKGEIIEHPTRTSIQVGKHKHIEDVIGGHINHSCSPSAKVNRKTMTFIALRDIQKGEELTFDYNENEEDMAEPFTCECCGQQVTGKKGKRVKTSLPA